MTSNTTLNLLHIINTLYKKIRENNGIIWGLEQEIYNYKKLLEDKNEEIKELRDCIMLRDLEIQDINNMLNKSTNIDKYIELEYEKQELSQLCNKLQNEYNNATISQLYDCEITL
jgi:hypothetical protein